VAYLGAVATTPLSTLPTAATDFERIEACLLENVSIEGDEHLSEIASHLIKAGGKRQRPHFTVAAAATGLPDGEPVADDVVRGGVAVELVQVGSLYHDDVMDEATMRRQVVSVNARWGNLRAILAGDFLLARASEIAASLGTEVAGLLARTIGDLCRGQVAELQTLYDINRTEEQYYPSIAGKTASLFSAATRIGGIVAGRDRATIDRLTEFGTLYGMAFQIVDDILDVIATDEQLGKPAGKDMLEGVYSLPVIYTLSSPLGLKLRELLIDGLSEADRRAAIELVRQGPAVERALKVAAGFVERAQAEILSVSGNRASQALADTAQHLLDSVSAASAA
jgi:heptaprenyl diphosphate synthase